MWTNIMNERTRQPITRTIAARQRGVSHVELMIAVALITVLSVTALPGVSNMLDRGKINGTRHQLLTDLNFARNTAVTSYRRVVICPSDDQRTCSGDTNWSSGWIVFQDFDANAERSGGERLLKVSSLNSSIDVNSGRRDRFRFYPDGTAPGSTGSIYLCIQGEPDMGHRLVVSNVGRVRSEEYHCS